MLFKVGLFSLWNKCFITYNFSCSTPCSDTLYNLKITFSLILLHSFYVCPFFKLRLLTNLISGSTSAIAWQNPAAYYSSLFYLYAVMYLEEGQWFFCSVGSSCCRSTDGRSWITFCSLGSCEWVPQPPEQNLPDSSESCISLESNSDALWDSRREVPWHLHHA